VPKGRYIDPTTSGATLPSRLAATLLDKVAGQYQRLQMLLQPIAVCGCHIGHLAVDDPLSIARQ